jgi:hypothetical protein
MLIPGRTWQCGRGRNEQSRPKRKVLDGSFSLLLECLAEPQSATAWPRFRATIRLLLLGSLLLGALLGSLFGSFLLCHGTFS